MPEQPKVEWVSHYDQSDDEAHGSCLFEAVTAAVSALTGGRADAPVPGYLDVDVDDVAACRAALEALRDDAEDYDDCDTLAAAWAAAEDWAGACLNDTCNCGWDWVNDGISTAADELVEWANKANHGPWWDEKTGVVDRLDLHELFYACHHGRGLTWFEVKVFDNGNVHVACDGDRLELRAITSQARRHLLDELRDEGADSDLLEEALDAPQEVVELAHKLWTEDEDYQLTMEEIFDTARACLAVAA